MQGEGWLYSTRKKIRGSNCDPTQADPTLFGTRPAYSKGISQKSVNIANHDILGY